MWSSNLIDGTVVISNPWILPLKILRCLSPRIVGGNRRRRWMVWCLIIAVLVPSRRVRRAPRHTTFIPSTTFTSIRLFWATSSHPRQPNPKQDKQNNRLQHFKHKSKIQINPTTKFPSLIKSNNTVTRRYIWESLLTLKQIQSLDFFIKSLHLLHCLNMFDSVNFTFIT